MICHFWFENSKNQNNLEWSILYNTTWLINFWIFYVIKILLISKFSYITINKIHLISNIFNDLDNITHLLNFIQILLNYIKNILLVHLKYI